MAWIYKLYEGVLWLVGLAKPEHLKALADQSGPVWVRYAILFAIVFSETGILVGFFLPGDSLLFAAGYLASDSVGVFDFFLLNLCLWIAAITGDAVNYYLGAKAGAQVFEKGRVRFVKHEHIMKAKAFFEKHGGKAIILARFVPIIRTFTPFVAGVAQMSYYSFAVFNIVGGICWVTLMSAAGYFLGQIPWVQKNFEAVVLAIIFISVLPIFIEWYLHRRASKQTAKQDMNPAENQSAS